METFVGDIVTIRMLSGVTLTGLDLYIKFRKPNGDIGRWPATIDGIDVTIAEYETVEADLDIPGRWHLQIYAEDGATYRGHGEVARLTVNEQLATLTDAPTTIAPTSLAPTTA